jgi:hypothetical protein
VPAVLVAAAALAARAVAPPTGRAGGEQPGPQQDAVAA